jgi:hypothetical protein
MICAGIWLALGLSFPDAPESFLSAALTFSTVLLGFVATTQAILMALPPDSIYGQLKKANYGPVFVTYFADAIYGLLLFSFMNLCGFFVSAKWNFLFQIVWALLAGFSFLSFHRVAKLTLRIMSK